jgi:hypothetical protein
MTLFFDAEPTAGGKCVRRSEHPSTLNGHAGPTSGWEDLMTTPIPHGTLADEFPDFDVGTLPAIPEGFVAAHWHNDVCPHWHYGEDYLTANPLLWIDYADPVRREFPDGKRFNLRWQVNEGDRGDEWCLEYTDDWAQILIALGHIDARVIVAKWVSRFGLGFHLDMHGADYVFDGTKGSIRMLNDKQAAEYDAEMERLFGLPGDPYQHCLDAMRAAGVMRDA